MLPLPSSSTGQTDLRFQVTFKNQPSTQGSLALSIFSQAESASYSTAVMVFQNRLGRSDWNQDNGISRQLHWCFTQCLITPGKILGVPVFCCASLLRMGDPTHRRKASCLAERDSHPPNAGWRTVLGFLNFQGR